MTKRKEKEEYENGEKKRLKRKGTIKGMKNERKEGKRRIKKDAASNNGVVDPKDVFLYTCCGGMSVWHTC